MEKSTRGYKVGCESPKIRTPQEKASKLDDTLMNYHLTPKEMSQWRSGDREKFIKFWEAKPFIHEYRVVKRVPKNGIKVISGVLTDAYVVIQTEFTYGRIVKLYVVVKKAGS